MVLFPLSVTHEAAKAYLLLQDRPGSREAFSPPTSQTQFQHNYKDKAPMIYQRSLGAFACEHLKAVSALTMLLPVITLTGMS